MLIYILAIVILFVTFIGCAVIDEYEMGRGERIPCRLPDSDNQLDK